MSSIRLPSHGVRVDRGRDGVEQPLQVCVVNDLQVAGWLLWRATWVMTIANVAASAVT
jgi:hypothetical protein